MSFSNINRVVLVGRLTQDPELRALPSGRSVCGLRVVCNASRRDGDGNHHERPNYFDVSAFGTQAENVSRYTRRGSLLAIDGRLEWREWETAEQQRRQTVSIVADSVQFLDSAPTADSGASGDGDGEGDGGQGEGEGEGEGGRQDEQEPAHVAGARAADALVF